MKSGWLRIGYPATGGVSFPVEQNINTFIPLKTILTWLAGDAAIRSLLHFPTRHRVASQPSPVRSFRPFKDLQMTYSAAYFADEPATIRQQLVVELDHVAAAAGSRQ